MPNNLKKLTYNFEMPALGMGTWKIGGRDKRNYNNDDQKDINALRAAIDSGINHIDTAESYADGYAETLVGQAIKKYSREKVFITSKVAQSSLKYKDVLNACKNSLKRLGINYLDLYLIHWPNSLIPLEETLKAMDELKKQGLIRNIGLSNFNKKQFLEAQSYTKNKIVALQLHYSLVCREPEKRGLLEFCQKNDVMLIAWQPLQYGFLASIRNPLQESICLKYKKTPSQIALNWLISKKNVVAISKTNNIDHIRENTGALGWNMDEEDIEHLRRSFPNQESVSSLRALA